MGLTRFRGPVYGSKALLWNFGPYTETRSSGGTTALYTANSVMVVPNYEDWYITEVSLNTSTNSTVVSGHGVYLKSEGGSTTGIAAREDGKPSTQAQTIFSLVSPGGSGAGSSTWSTWATATATAGEYEGTWVPAGSSLRVVSSGITLISGLQLNIRGYIRYVNSTRSEG